MAEGSQKHAPGERRRTGRGTGRLGKVEVWSAVIAAEPRYGDVKVGADLVVLQLHLYEVPTVAPLYSNQTPRP